MENARIVTTRYPLQGGWEDLSGNLTALRRRSGAAAGRYASCGNNLLFLMFISKGVHQVFLLGMRIA
jgi:hypothetical protein